MKLRNETALQAWLKIHRDKPAEWRRSYEAFLRKTVSAKEKADPKYTIDPPNSDTSTPPQDVRATLVHPHDVPKQHLSIATVWTRR